MATVPSAFQPYVVSISGLSYATNSDEYGLPDMRWWGEGSITLSGRIKVRVKYSTKAGVLIGQNDYIIESGQTRTFSNPSGQDMVVFLLETVPAEVYTCPHCGMTFSTQAHLNAHIASEHPIVPPPPPPPPGPPGRFTWNGCKLIFAGHIDVDDVLAAGFNTVIGYVSKTFLDDCLKKGLWVIPSVHTFFNSSPVDLAGAVAFIHEWKNYPAVAAWWFLNEPDLRSHMTSANQKTWYAALKAEDPNHDLLTTFTAHIEKNWEPSAFDQVSFDAYPYTVETPLWKPRLQNSCSVCKTRSGGIGGMAVAQGYYGCGQLDPEGIIDDMLEVWQEYGIGTQSDGYAIYAWTDGGDCPGGGTGISEDTELLAHMTTVNASYPWPHAPPGEITPPPPPPPPPPPVYTCPQCGATFSTQGDLDAHIASEHPVLTLVDTTCPTCGSIFRIAVSSSAGENITITCPVDQTSLPVQGVEIREILAIPEIDILKAEIAVLDERIATLQITIDNLTEEIGEIREALGG